MSRLYYTLKKLTKKKVKVMCGSELMWMDLPLLYVRLYHSHHLPSTNHVCSYINVDRSTIITGRRKP